MIKKKYCPKYSTTEYQDTSTASYTCSSDHSFPFKE